MADLQDKVGARGDVWVVGAQNAGKSSLINAMQKLAGISSKQQVTTAALPGTTLGKFSMLPCVPHASIDFKRLSKQISGVCLKPRSRLLCPAQL